MRSIEFETINSMVKGEKKKGNLRLKDQGVD